MFFNDFTNQLQILDAQIHALTEQLSHCPQGQITVCHAGKHSKWYCSHGKNRSYLRKKERKKAESLAKKKLCQLRLEEMELEKSFLTSCLKKTKPLVDAQQNLLSDHAYRELLFSATASHQPARDVAASHQPARDAAVSHHPARDAATSHQPARDAAASHQPARDETTNHLVPADSAKNPVSSSAHLPPYPERRIHRCISGNIVRSKSESLIDTCLYNHHLTYQYEAPLIFETDSPYSEYRERELFPDFTILHPTTGKLVYWEHFGLMDDPDYRNQVVQKLRIYFENGFIPGINLIITFETGEHPLDICAVEEQIKMYLS